MPSLQPPAPHGLPGHLVGFVEALRAQGISVGPSETVDAGRVLTVLGLGDREALREGFACAVLRRADHRPAYDAMFDLWWPAALGDRTVVSDDEPADGPPPVHIETLRAMLTDLLSENPDIGDQDQRLVALVAQIVEAHGRYTSSRGPSYSSYQALKAMGLDELEGRLLAGLLAPHGDEPSPTQEQIAKAIAARKISQLRRIVDSETKRRSAEQLGREHVQMYGVPQLSENVEFLRASGDQLRQMRRVVRLIKKFARSRDSWKASILSGFGITKLVAECYKPHAGLDDTALYETMEAIRNKKHMILMNAELDATVGPRTSGVVQRAVPVG